MYAPPSSKVYTPSRLAKAVVTWLRRVDPTSTSLWLEPCAGDGAFCRAMRSAGVASSQITALDLDRGRAQVSPIRVRSGIDFVRWSMHTRKRFDVIVANPPYVALTKLSASLRSVVASVLDTEGDPVPGNSNYWFVFLVASLHLLKVGGSLAFVLPAAWDYADYALAMRRSIGARFRRVEVHRSATPLFPDVKDGSVVLLATGFANAHELEVRFEHDDLSAMVAALSADSVQDRGRSVPRVGQTSGRRTKVFGDIFDVRLGAVTGDASFFLLNDATRRKTGLPRQALRPVVSRSNHLRQAVISRRAWEELLACGERVWLFRPPAGMTRSGPVRSYMRRATADGGCNRTAYKVATRKPWYRPRMPRRVDGYLSGMSPRGPWVAWRGMRGLGATNTLYVLKCRSALIRRQRFAWSLALLTTSVRAQLPRVGRVYADGLLKFEPGDLAGLVLPVPARSSSGRNAYARAIRALLAGEEMRAMEIADAWFGFGRRGSARVERGAPDVRPRGSIASAKSAS